MTVIDYTATFGKLDSMYRIFEHNGLMVKSPSMIYETIKYVMQQMYQDRENMLNVMLNTKNQIIGIEIIAIGTLNACICHPREVFYPAVANKAASIIIAHNHPSGDPTPSAEDITVAQRIMDGGKLLGINLLDSIVVGADSYVSLMDDGLIR